MGKRLFLLIIASLIGVVNTPKFLMAADTAEVLGIGNGVETVEIIEEVEDEVPVAASPRSEAPANSAVLADASDAAQPAAQPSADAISVVGRVIPIVRVTDTMVDAGDHVNKYGEKFLYGHNSAGVFGGLVNLGVGSVFTVAEGGVATNYQVIERVIYKKVSDVTLQDESGKDYRMTAIANGRGKYDMVLMTCHGAAYGNGDASHRLVIFANAV